MKIIQVLNHFLPYNFAGTEVYTWSLSKRLQQNGISVEILIPNYCSSNSNEYIYDGLKIRQYAETSVVDRGLIMGFREPDGLFSFIAHLNELKPDIVHFQEIAGSNGVTNAHIMAAKATGAKVIMTFHLATNTCKTGSLVYKNEHLCNGVINIQKCATCFLHSKNGSKLNVGLSKSSFALFKLGIDSSKWNHPIGTALGTVFIINRLKQNFNKLIENCDQVVVLTEWYKKILLLNNVSEDKITHISQGLPFGFASQIPADSNLDTKGIRLVFLGRISLFKGLHLLLEAILSMPEYSIGLDIYGQTDNSQYEEDWKKKTQNIPNVLWKGKLLQDEVLNTLKKYDALCICSTFSEMSPLVIQEAFAAGIPVIASNVYGNSEQITHDYNGLLFRFKDVASLRVQLIRCFEESNLLYKLKKNIKPPKSFDEVGEAYAKLYHKILSE